MQKVYLSDSGPKVSKAIYSFWRWEHEKMTDAKRAEGIVETCLELGINTFDYGDTSAQLKTEELVRNILNTKSVKREDLVLFAKCGIRNDRNGFTYFDNSRQYLLDSVDSFLKDLQTDYLDMFLLNGFDYTANPEETAVALQHIVHTGKAKHIGIANFTGDQHKLLAKYLRIPIVTSHIELNLLNTSPIRDGRIDFIKEQYSKPLVWAPLAGGQILEGGSEQAIRIRKILNQVAEKHDANLEQIAVAWLMSLGVLPIIGSLKKERIANVATATDIQLSKEDWYEIYYASLKK
ncbi:aldo/keto reductase [Jiulongibacter sediminis]|uniref:Aldo/keto reductase n=1 Tax=Jiulongibacter sediminis TaxID=1605367 RepID=A0A0P7C0K3_9BACT|nr:aldo/keto reductase [Jiulongibacter sediminis]KPM47545.1 aldo/keto reductase [Jiulongibacter sediminis]TBX23339.1 aldo/keto reductase [Jiulongibacter sediminis]